MDTPVEYTTGANATWTDIDVSANVPSGASGVILKVYNNKSTSGDTFGVRKNGSSDSFVRAFESAGYKGLFMIGVDENRIFEAYTSANNANYKIQLIGYTGSDVVFFTNKIDKSPTSNSTWQDQDITANVTEGDTAIGAIVMLYNQGNSHLAVRKNGSTDTKTQHDYRYGMHAIVGLDENEIFETYTNDKTYGQVFVLGYIKNTCNITFNTNVTDYSVGTAGAYTDLTALPTGATGGFFMCSEGGGGATLSINLRENGSSTDNYKKIMDYVYFGVKADSNRLIEAKVENTAVKIYLVAYTT